MNSGEISVKYFIAFFRSPVNLSGLNARLKFFFLLLLVTGKIFAQTEDPLVTLTEQNVSLETIFNKIQNQTGYHFLYESKILENTRKVSITVKNMPVSKVLDICFTNLQLGFKIVEKTIVINRVEPAAIATPPWSPEWIRFSGIVLNADKSQPVRSASVKVLNHSQGGVATNEQGYFDLKIPAGTLLQISCIGYEKQELVVKDSKTVTIYLKPIPTALGEVVVSNNGYQELDQRMLTSAITTLKAKDIVVPGMLTIDQTLEGRVPGLFVLTNSGEVGTAPKIRIRGTATILGNQEPLWVVDGVVVNSPVNIDPQTINDLDFVNRLGNAISGLNPADIEQIDVLKDASSTALYGVRAANGVIVITTKKGHPGPPVITYSLSGTYTRRPRYTDGNINVMNSLQRIDYSKELVSKGLDYPNTVNWVGYEGAIHNLYNGTINYNQFQQEVQNLETMNTDWFGVITQDAVSSQNNLSISGGTNKMKYFASVGISSDPGTVKGNKIQRYTSTINLNAEISDRLRWNLSLMGDVDNRDYIASSVNALDYAYHTSRAVPAYNPDGSLYYYQKYASSAGYGGYYNFNIRNEMQNSPDVSNTGGMRLNTNLNYSFNEALKATVLFAYAFSNTNQQITYNDNTFYAAGLRQSELGKEPNPYSTLMPVGGELQTNLTRNNSYTVRTQLDFYKDLQKNSKHIISSTIGAEVSSNQYKNFNTIQRGYLPDRGETFAAIDPTKYPSYAQWALLDNPDVVKDQLENLVSGYFTAAYTYDEKYTVNFNTRTDFSNKFGSRSNEKFLPTWSVSGRWNIAEDFFKNSNQVNLLALRSSFGFQGNMLDNQTPNLIIRQGAADPITGEYFSTISYYPNPNLRWEKTGELDGAIDFALFGNKISGSLGYFYKKTQNAFVDKNISDVNGMDSYVVNAGTLINHGIELSLSFTPINNIAAKGGKGFTWRVDPQLGQVVNKLLTKALTPDQNALATNANTYNSYLNGMELINGKALNSFYSYQFNGLSAVNGMPTFKNDDTSNAGKYAGMSPDQVFQTVMQPTGNRVPVLQGGISNYFSYNHIFLSCNITYSVGSKIRLMKLYPNSTSSARTAAPLPEENVSTSFLSRWEKPGDELHTNIPGLLNGYDYLNTITHWSQGQPYQYADNIWQMYDNSDVRVVSGNYVKIQSVVLGYKIPEKTLQKLKMKDLYLSVSGMNLYTFASRKLNGQDPAQSGFANIELSPRPAYSFQIQVSF